MAGRIPTVIKVDLEKSILDQSSSKHFHNRWHPDIPPVAQVKPEETFRVECVEWTGGQIKNDDDASDILNVDLSRVHVISGPIKVEGAEAGDVLEVEILEVQPLPGHEWGYTGIFAEHNGGGGFLCDKFKEAKKAVWDLDGIYATSRHIPGVKFAGLIHPGVIGCAPSAELLAEWNRREQELINTNPNRVPALAYPPLSTGALVGNAEGTKEGEKIKREGARTVPPREHGGNVDIKNLSRGSKVWLPVYVKGANLSIGDIHFSEGDGAVCLCGGIEMSGIVTLRTKIIKNGISLHAMKNPIFLPGPVEPSYSKYLTFQGISVDDNGKQHCLDANISFRQAVLNCIAYFKRFGYSEEQIYLLLSCCPSDGRINEIVDTPNALCSLAIPTDIFDFDVLPQAGGHVAKPRGREAYVRTKK